MIYPSNFESKIGFDKIREQIVEDCSTQYAKELAQRLHFIADYDKIRILLAQTHEMREIMLMDNTFPTGDYADSYSDVKRLSIPESFLDTKALVRLKNSIETVRALLNFFSNSSEDKYLELKRLAEPIMYYPAIGQRIDSILDKFGEIRDNASPHLLEVRQTKKEKQQHVSKRIQSLLKEIQAQGFADSDASVSVRDGHLVIPVSSSAKKKVSGLVLDESPSGKTSYMEPLEIVNLNNAIRELEFEEQREIVRILMSFADFIRPYLEELLLSLKFVSVIDFIKAKARVAIQMEAGCPAVVDEPILNIIRARHPILQSKLAKEEKPIVPLTVSLDGNKRILLISGPNAGGKSVCLETVGLLQYMLQCGLLVPAAESSEFGVFESVFIDIGDEQSIENDLSTYSSHLKNMRTILENATSRSLILIDEFGSGTEPVAGGAIAEALLEEWEKIGCMGIITTHYSNLKFYATSSNSVINGAMQFDTVNIMPLFKLEIGVPGNSFAFELARKTGLPDKLINVAKEKAGSDYVDLEKQLKSIARNKRKWEEKVVHIKRTDKILENITDKYSTELADIKKLRKEILQEAKAKAEEIVNEANRKIENTIREIKEAQAEKERTKEIREQLKDFKQTLESVDSSQNDEKIERKIEALRRRREKRAEREEKRNAETAKETKLQKIQGEDVKPWCKGDKVKFKDSDITGEVCGIKGDKLYIGVGSMYSWISQDKLERISQNEYKSANKVVQKVQPDMFNLNERRLNFVSSIDIRGARLEGALQTIERFIDDAIMIGVTEVKILHGKGNGVLRQEIRKFLKSYGNQLTFADEDIQRGGAGITVVRIL